MICPSIFRLFIAAQVFGVAALADPYYTEYAGCRCLSWRFFFFFCRFNAQNTCNNSVTTTQSETQRSDMDGMLSRSKRQATSVKLRVPNGELEQRIPMLMNFSNSNIIVD